MDAKATLHRYLRTARTDLLGKIDGLSEYDARRPLTPTGTNLLGLVKHVASVQLGYLTDTFGRPSDVTAPWLADDAPPDSDMWVPADESRASIIAFHEASARVTDEVIEALDLDAAGTVPWWPDERSAVTLHQVLVHVLAETARHAGHADILREHLDGLAGQRVGDANVPDRSSDQWSAYAAQIEAAAREVASAAGERTPEAPDEDRGHDDDMAETTQLEINAHVIEQFRAGGPIEGMHRDRLLLLTTTGRSSGEPRTAPMMFHLDGGRPVVIASAAGAPRDPHWYDNLVADPRVHVELADEDWDAHAVVATGEEHDRLWADITAAYPFFVEHLAKAGRTIPLVILERA